MEVTNTLEFRNREIAALSWGQRQRVWLAMALAQETDILLLDEPTTYLDMAHQLEVLEIIQHLYITFGCTIIMVLHDLNHLGGLFVLWSYLTYPDSFYKFVAISPSIWWNNHELFRTIQQVVNPFAAPLYIGVGGEEGDMVDDAQKFAAMASEKRVNCEFYIAECENHASVIPTTMSRVLRFLK